MTTWKLEDAKNGFSEVVRRAVAGEPQRVTRNGRDAVVVLSAEAFDRLAVPAEPLAAFLRRSPLAAAPIDVARPRDVGRFVDL